MRRGRRRIVLTVPELGAVTALLVYGIGAVAFALFGAAFFAWLFVLALVVAPFAVVAVRRRRSRLAQLRAARRRARAAAYQERSLEWEEAA